MKKTVVSHLQLLRLCSEDSLSKVIILLSAIQTYFQAIRCEKADARGLWRLKASVMSISRCVSSFSRKLLIPLSSQPYLSRRNGNLARPLDSFFLGGCCLLYLYFT